MVWLVECLYIIAVEVVQTDIAGKLTSNWVDEGLARAS